MNEEQIRKDFEEWMGDGGLSPRALERNSKGDYRLMQAANAWEVWKAAHTHYAKSAAPVVLPEPGINTASHAGFRVIGYTEQQVRELLDKATCTKSQTAQEPFGYFKAEPFGWRDCAETDEGAIALYEAPQPQAVDQAPVAWRYQTPTGWHATTDAAAANRVSAHHPTEPLYAAPQPQADALDTERLDWLIEQGCSHGVVYELDKSFWIVWLDGHDAHKDKHQIGRHHTAREAIDAAIAAAEAAHKRHAQPQADGRDAQRYRWLIDYFISDRVDLDDAIVAAKTSEDIAKIIDAAIAAAKEMK